jgi:DNA-binding transcriptional MerR regulator
MSKREQEVFLPESQPMSLAELTEAADVSVRTVRYYIGEGLLPPPEGAGPGSSYGRGHLDRLRLIQRLKSAYLPLKEIRRRLAGLSDDDVQALLSVENERETAMLEEAVSYDASLADARKYLSLLESGGRYRTEPMRLAVPAAPDASASPQAMAKVDLAPDLAPVPARSRGPRAAGVFSARAVSERPQSESGGETLWRRIPLGDEAELVISERVYGRHRDRVDWLVRWARKVFG